MSKTMDVVKGAEISSDGLHRLSLTRIWDADKPVLGWIMLNPSTADADIDDPTVRKCMGYARRWGYGGIEVGNLFTYRTKSPKVLRVVDPLFRNDLVATHHLLALLLNCERVVVGWGTHGDRYQDRVSFVKKMLSVHAIEAVHLGLTKAGQPKHPCYLSYKIAPEKWNLEASP